MGHCNRAEQGPNIEMGVRHRAEQRPNIEMMVCSYPETTYNF